MQANSTLSSAVTLQQASLVTYRITWSLEWKQKNQNILINYHVSTDAIYFVAFEVMYWALRYNPTELNGEFNSLRT